MSESLLSHQRSTTCILRIAIPGPLRKLFEYLPPEQDVNLPLLPGMRLQVPFGKQTKIGTLIEICNHTDYPLDKLKAVEAILDPHPLLGHHLLKLIHWASHYYLCPLSTVLDSALPLWLRKGKTNDIRLAPQHQETAESLTTSSPTFSLNAEQTLAIQVISQHLHEFKAFLIDGVTGSGKTEIYLQIIQQVLNLNRQALVLVPEIGLTPQILKRFQERFSCKIALLHSSLSEKKRFMNWEMARTGEAKIIIGTRSSVFTPLKNPGIFILDEEHDLSFKQQEGFRYSARDLLMIRGRMENCPVVLGSATPSFESIHNVHQGRYQLLDLPYRAGLALQPTFQILDIRHKQLIGGFSAQLIAKIKEHLSKQNQVLLFLNRRGYAPVLMCYDCGHVIHCKHCDAHMTLHQGDQKVRCHHCEFSYVLPKHCEKCTSSNLQPVGVGTEQIEEVLNAYFPKFKIARIDRDTTRKKGSLEKSLDSILSFEAQILVGTQMLAKGHHFPKVTLVGILDIDSALFSSDFRSLERLGQLLMQVAGRAGRGEDLGEVILQTCHPDNHSLQTLLNSGYRAFAEHLLLERKMAGLPPYSFQALLRVEAKTRDLAFAFLKDAKIKIQQLGSSNIQIFGPSASPMERRQGKYRAQLLIQSEKRSILQNALHKLVDTLEAQPPKGSLRWSLDVDPCETL